MPSGECTFVPDNGFFILLLIKKIVFNTHSTILVLQVNGVISGSDYVSRSLENGRNRSAASLGGSDSFVLCAIFFPRSCYCCYFSFVFSFFMLRIGSAWSDNHIRATGGVPSDEWVGGAFLGPARLFSRSYLWWRIS